MNTKLLNRIGFNLDGSGLGGGNSIKSPNSIKGNYKEYLGASQYIKEFAKNAALPIPAAIFTLPKEKKEELLVQYVQEAVKQFDTLDIALSIFKWRYPAKILNYVPTNKDQAAGFLGLLATVKLSLYSIFEGDEPIVEDGKILNGGFARKNNCRNPEHLEMANQVADTMYLPTHDQQHELPQASFIIFGAKCRTSEEFEKKKEIVVAYREAFKEQLGNTLIGKNQFKISDPKHNSTTKFRLLCTVFDMEKSRLMVVSDKNGEATPFTEWAPKNLNDILSASKGELAEIKAYAERPGGLLEQLMHPRNGDPAYRPWASLLEKTGDYRKANKIWRYAMLQRQIAKVKEYEEVTWPKMKQVMEIMEAIIRMACNDGREPGDIKLLAAIASRKEFMDFFTGENAIDMRMLLFTPHYICGMLTALHGMHNTFRRIEKIQENLRHNPPEGVDGEFEYQRNMEFFQGLMDRIMAQKGPVSERLILRDYLPPYLQKEMNAYLSDLDNNRSDGGEKTENRQIVEFLYDLLVNNDETLRSVVRRGFEARLLERDGVTGLPSMSAAKATYERLNSFFGEDYAKEFSKPQINSFVIEEAVRRALLNYSNWMQEVPEDRRVLIVPWLDNNINGQGTAIPVAPQSPQDYKPDDGKIMRKDFILNNWFSPQEREELFAWEPKLKAKLEINMPA